MASETTLLEHFTTIFNRELDKLIMELNGYSDESYLWFVAPQINNSAGNLSLHLVGNLNHFIGATLGRTGYVRQRDLEFSQKEVSRQHLIDSIDQTKSMIAQCLSGLSEEELKKEFPQNPFEGSVSNEYFLLHLLTHLSYHLGQVNYHRRLLDKYQ